MAESFIIIKSDDKVFTGDKIRFDLSESFLQPGDSYATPISHELSFDGGVTWFDVSTKKYIDWIFGTNGLKTVIARISSLNAGLITKTKIVESLDLTSAKLFSNDNDLYRHETDIDQYLPKRWSSWNLIHLESQKWIIDWLDEKRIFNENGDKYTVDDLMDLQQVRQLSVYKTLQFIFESNSKVVGDLFSIKADKYLKLADEKAARSQLKLDFNGDGETTNSERTDLLSVGVIRA